jgi:hypothetical protein
VWHRQIGHVDSSQSSTLGTGKRKEKSKSNKSPSVPAAPMSSPVSAPMQLVAHPGYHSPRMDYNYFPEQLQVAPYPSALQYYNYNYPTNFGNLSSNYQLYPYYPFATSCQTGLCSSPATCSTCAQLSIPIDSTTSDSNKNTNANQKGKGKGNQQSNKGLNPGQQPQNGGKASQQHSQKNKKNQSQKVEVEENDGSGEEAENATERDESEEDEENHQSKAKSKKQNQNSGANGQNASKDLKKDNNDGAKGAKDAKGSSGADTQKGNEGRKSGQQNQNQKSKQLKIVENAEIPPSIVSSPSASLSIVNQEQIRRRRRFLSTYEQILAMDARYNLVCEQVAPLNPILASPPPPNSFYGSKFEFLFESDIMLRWTLKKSICHVSCGILGVQYRPYASRRVHILPLTPNPIHILMRLLLHMDIWTL